MNSQGLQSVLRIIVESTALSAGWCVLFIAAYSTQSNLRFLVDITPNVVGALSMLVYMRTGMCGIGRRTGEAAKFDCS
ncbi:hypothetical protein DFH09DRAFT_1306201 [Mycena vulgaris]|nr:hypothetical protein DFH09DRAFT_1306201 [Mycena vulgaris]